MSHILIITTELPIISGAPAGGRGTRITVIAEILKEKGHIVTISVAAENIEFLQNKFNLNIPDEFIENQHNYFYDEIIKKINPDVIFFSPWIILKNFTNITLLKKIPVVVDLCGSLLLENIYEKIEDDMNFLTEKIFSLNKADFFCVANQRQKYYLYSILMLSGIDIKQNPFCLLPICAKKASDELSKFSFPPKIISGGVFWRWHEYGEMLDTIAVYVEKNGGTFDIYSGKFIYKKYEPLELLKKNYTNTTIHRLINYTNLPEIFLNANAVFDAYLLNPERELAMTTRTIDYLSSGLPVIYSDGMYLSDFIKKYDAGWIINPKSTKDLIKVLDNIYSSPDVCRLKGINAIRLINENFLAVNCINELSDFLNKPFKLTNNKNFIYNLCDTICQNAYTIEKFRNELDNKNNEIFLNIKEINTMRNCIDSQKNNIEYLQKEVLFLKSDLERITGRTSFKIMLKLKKILDILKK